MTCSHFWWNITCLNHLWSFVIATIEQYKSINCIMFLISWSLTDLKECTWQVKLPWSTASRKKKKKKGLSLKFPAISWERIVRSNIEHYVVPQAHLNNFTLKRITGEETRSTPKWKVLLRDRSHLKREFACTQIWKKIRTRQACNNISLKCPPRFQLLVSQFPHTEVISST